MVEKFENVALILQLGLPSTLISYENGAFRKRTSNRRNLKAPALCFSKYETRGRLDNHVISSYPRVCTQAFLPSVTVGFSNISGGVLEDGKH